MEKGMFGDKFTFRHMLVLDVWAILEALQAAAPDCLSVSSTSEFPLMQPGLYVAGRVIWKVLLYLYHPAPLYFEAILVSKWRPELSSFE